MLEVPSLLCQLDELMQAVDFVSVGSNDLFQFVMAVDRGNTQRGRPLRSAVGAVPARAASRSPMPATRNNTPVTLCGELAGKPIAAMALIGLGYRSISMSPASIGPVKAMLTELPLDELTGVLRRQSRWRRRTGCRCAALLQAFAERPFDPVVASAS